MLQTKPARKMFTQRLYAVTLGCMVPGGNEGDSSFLRNMHILF